mgnify:CR=1 FL=1
MPSDEAARMLAARAEIVERLLKSRNLHGLDDGQLVAVGVHSIAAVPTLSSSPRRRRKSATLKNEIHSRGIRRRTVRLAASGSKKKGSAFTQE